MIKLYKTKWESNDRKYDSGLIVYNDDNRWIFNRFRDFFVNETKDEIILLKKEIHFHQFGRGDYFEKHNDGTKKRVYGVGCLLNDDYEGGDFIFYNNPKEIIKKEVGNSYIFNVNIEHEVKEIISGNRFSLLWFLEDSNLKIKNKTLI